MPIRYICLLMFLLTAPRAAAQEETEYRLELGAGAGLGFGLTDVNDKFFGNAQPAGGLLARFLLNPRMSIKTAAGYTRLTGNTGGRSAFYPAVPDNAGNEQLDFKADAKLYSLSASYELNFLPYGFQKSYQGFSRITPFIQVGLGLAYSDAGRNVAFNIPIGAGVKYKVGPRLNLGLDWQMHFSLSDKLEGLEAPLGISSSGFRNKDHFSLTMLTLTYDLSPRCPNCNKD